MEKLKAEEPEDKLDRKFIEKFTEEGGDNIIRLRESEVVKKWWDYDFLNTEEMVNSLREFISENYISREKHKEELNKKQSKL